MKRFLKIFRYTLLLAFLSLLALLGISPFYIYDRFNQETPVARLRFEATGQYTWLAVLSHGDFCSEQAYPVQGDQFQLDAGFVKWKALGVLLGLEPLYRLDRLSGRYSDIRLQNSRETLAHDLAPDVLFDFFADNPAGDSGWLADTVYGSSVYLGIDPTLQYTVYATEDGLITRAEMRQDFSRDNGQLVIAIERGCGNPPGLLENASEKINAMALAWLR